MIPSIFLGSSLGVITSLVAKHMYFLPAYALIAQDFTMLRYILIANTSRDSS